MIPIKEIKSAFIADVNANLKTDLGLKSVVPHHPKYDKQTLAMLMPLAPFLLVRYEGMKPVESERRADGSSGLNRQRLGLVIGAEGLVSAEDTRNDCEDIVDAIRDQYDGYVLAIPGYSQIEMAVESEDFLASDGGLFAYYAVYSFVNQ